MTTQHIETFAEWAATKEYIRNARTQLLGDPVIALDVVLYAEMLKTINHLEHACDEFIDKSVAELELAL